jgi:hypothetical protein
MKRIVGLLVFIFCGNILFAQIGVGEWRDHLSFRNTESITESSKKVYVASESGIFTYSKTSNNIEKLTKVNVLSDIGISSINYSDNNTVLVVGYGNGNIDLVYNTTVFNLSDIKRETINGSKCINNIYFIDEFAYLSCGFGIVVVNLEKREIKETYYIGDLGSLLSVHELKLDNNYLYAATNQGIYIADYTDQNLADFSNWGRLTTIPNYTLSFNSIVVRDGKLLVNQNNDSFNDDLYLYENGSWTVFNSTFANVRKIKESESQIQVITDEKILIYNWDFDLENTIESNESATINPYDVSTLDDNTYYVADRGNGLRKVNGTFELINPNAPFSSNAYNIATAKDKVIVAAGGLTSSWNNKFLNGAYFTFEKERWKSLFNYQAKDYVVAKIDPQNSNHYFFGAWGHGVVEYQNNEIVETYSYANSSLQTVISGQNYVRIGGMAFDNENNLWITNSSVSNPISVRKSDGSWKSFNYENAISDILVSEIIVTQSNHKWVVLPNGNGLFVFENNQTIDNENDDQFKKLNIVDENGKIITNRINSIVEDLNGEIWLGTDQGIVVYYNPSNVFGDDLFYARRIIVTIGDVTDYLLKSEVINSIAVDGANRKWIGTESSGVYLVSKDGTEELNHFTEENSPLLSNKIYDVEINHESGEVFFATDKGLVSYRGTATMGSDEFRDVYVYPNPVRENYTGDITIRGLVSDVNVKITDISGNLVYETTAEGGQATWDGKNFDGKRSSTGVYLVFCTNDDGSKTYISKLLFIK